MSNLAVTTNLLFFQAEKYYYQNHHTFDTSDCPRPHFCMGLVLSGEGVFTDCNSNEKIIIMPGDIIFVPMSSTYVVNWSGSPQISYISAHFIFDRQSIFSSRNHFKLQKMERLLVKELLSKEKCIVNM